MPSISVSGTVLKVTDSPGSNTITIGTSNGGVTANLNGYVVQYNPGRITSINVIDSGTDTVFVQGTLTKVPLTITEQSSSDLVYLGYAGSVQGILGTVAINNQGASNIITVDDAVDTTTHTMLLTTYIPPGDTAWGTIQGLAPAGISYRNAGTLGVNLRTGRSGHETVNVLATGVATTVISNGLTSVNVSRATGILGTLNIGGLAGSNTINVYDSAFNVPETISLNNEAFVPGSGSITGLSPADINYNYMATSSVTIHTLQSGLDTVNVLATGVTTNLIGNGLTWVNVGNAHSVQGIQGTLNIENPQGSSVISVDDSADTAAHAAVLSPFTRAGDSDAWGSLSGLAAAINYEYSDTSSLAIRVGANTSTNVQNTNLVPTTINGRTV
jgi:hypothetical protein